MGSLRKSASRINPVTVEPSVVPAIHKKLDALNQNRVFRGPPAIGVKEKILPIVTISVVTMV